MSLWVVHGHQPTSNTILRENGLLLCNLWVINPEDSDNKVNSSEIMKYPLGLDDVNSVLCKDVALDERLYTGKTESSSYWNEAYMQMYRDE